MHSVSRGDVSHFGGFEILSIYDKLYASLGITLRRSQGSHTHIESGRGQTMKIGLQITSFDWPGGPAVAEF